MNIEHLGDRLEEATPPWVSGLGCIVVCVLLSWELWPDKGILFITVPLVLLALCALWSDYKPSNDTQ